MTNREMLNTLDNEELSFTFYRFIVNYIGIRYMETIGGVADWLGQKADLDMWLQWHGTYQNSKRQ